MQRVKQKTKSHPRLNSIKARLQISKKSLEDEKELNHDPKAEKETEVQGSKETAENGQELKKNSDTDSCKTDQNPKLQIPKDDFEIGEPTGGRDSKVFKTKLHETKEDLLDSNTKTTKESDPERMRDVENRNESKSPGENLEINMIKESANEKVSAPLTIPLASKSSKADKVDEESVTSMSVNRNKETKGSGNDKQNTGKDTLDAQEPESEIQKYFRQMENSAEWRCIGPHKNGEPCDDNCLSMLFVPQANSQNDAEEISETMCSKNVCEDTEDKAVGIGRHGEEKEETLAAIHNRIHDCNPIYLTRPAQMAYNFADLQKLHRSFLSCGDNEKKSKNPWYPRPVSPPRNIPQDILRRNVDSIFKDHDKINREYLKWQQEHISRSGLWIKTYKDWFLECRALLEYRDIFGSLGIDRTPFITSLQQCCSQNRSVLHGEEESVRCKTEERARLKDTKSTDGYTKRFKRVRNASRRKFDAGKESAIVAEIYACLADCIIVSPEGKIAKSDYGVKMSRKDDISSKPQHSTSPKKGAESVKSVSHCTIAVQTDDCRGEMVDTGTSICPSTQETNTQTENTMLVEEETKRNEDVGTQFSRPTVAQRFRSFFAGKKKKYIE